ncbi:S49 family peptidase [Noviherbaspirillum denitrificans]|uniref:Peptidase S49 n=1 Tax=Noviherbaspirillum denitrificans TaxID=1968433 RepID=A0A254THI0_9BURK|nr:S49 family peptidase [Noviherbaspirillum denitrificans]OWW22100.1 peptidase S49 [Noviherbaspirillum denitrificans]
MIEDNFEEQNQIRTSVPPSASHQGTGWEREVLEKLAFATLREQRAARRWNIFFRIVTLSLIGFGMWLAFGYTQQDAEVVGPHTALIEIDGTIESGTSGSADAVIQALNRAYSDESSVGVVLRINSPGGSPVQAGMINDEIGRLRQEFPKKPLYVVVDEICASGGYYIAAAADKIFVNKASIVGSIGVLMDGFGFTGLMDKAGIERRLMTAGENKGFLDPFSPQSAKHRNYAQDMLNEVHQQFIDVVRHGRGDRLKETPETFSGLFWSGSKAVEIGLADGFGTVDSVARDELKAEDIVDYTQREGLSERLLKKFGGAVGTAVVNSLWTTSARPAFR